MRDFISEVLKELAVQLVLELIFWLISNWPF
jgi:hypothetical protein